MKEGRRKKKKKISNQRRKKWREGLERFSFLLFQLALSITLFQDRNEKRYRLNRQTSVKIIQVVTREWMYATESCLLVLSPSSLDFYIDFSDIWHLRLLTLVPPTQHWTSKAPFIPASSILASCLICNANSLVGLRQRTEMRPICGRVCDLQMDSMEGIKKAKVLPVPVFAWANRSTPERAGWRVFAWTSVMNLKDWGMEDRILESSCWDKKRKWWWKGRKME